MEVLLEKKKNPIRSGSAGNEEQVKDLYTLLSVFFFLNGL